MSTTIEPNPEESLPPETAPAQDGFTCESCQRLTYSGDGKCNFDHWFCLVQEQPQ